MRPAVVYSLLALILLAVAVIAITTARGDSATADEGAHIAAGVMKLRHGWLDCYKGQPPLADSHAAMLIVAAGYDFPRVSGNVWAVGKQFLYQSGYDPYRLLWLARLPSIVMLLALVAAVFFFVRRWTARPEWALAAAALTGFCPTLLAHGRLATSDVWVAFFLFAAMALCLSMFDAPRSVPLAAGLGLTVALAVLVKMSALIVGPYLALLFVLRMVRGPRDWKPLVRPIAIAVATALTTFVATYALLAGADYLSANGMTRLTAGFRAYAGELAIIDYYYRGDHGHMQFLLGEFATHGWPHYYLVAIGLKTPLAALVLIAAGVVLGLRRDAPFALHACLLFMAVFVAALMRSNVALGVRYALPFFPFAYAAAGIALSQLRRRAVVDAAAAGLVAWHVASSVAAYPSYISYFNEFVRDERARDRYLIDSNLDWGQDLRRLDAWCRANGVDALTVHYVGGGEPSRDLSVRVTEWQGPNGPPPPRGFFALSRHYYRLTFAPALSPVSYETYFRRHGGRYVTTVGGSIDVWRID